MARVQTVKDLKVWQKSIDLTVQSYRVTSGFPAEEKFGLVSQIRRAAASIPANIAEGFGRWNQREFARFLAIASGSLRELETHFLVASRLGYIPPNRLNILVSSVEENAKMLYVLMSRIHSRQAKPRTVGR